MTRINLIDPSLLMDAHLIAEERELVRIPNMVIANKISRNGAPNKYTVRTEDHPEGGNGHVKFFINKLKWLHDRYERLYAECCNRGFNVIYKWPNHNFPTSLYNDYSPDADDIKLNLTRILERFPKNSKMHSDAIDKDTYQLLVEHLL